MHFCQDELFAILSLVPFLGAGWLWLRARYQATKRIALAYLGKEVPAPVYEHTASCMVGRKRLQIKVDPHAALERATLSRLNRRLKAQSKRSKKPPAMTIDPIVKVEEPKEPIVQGGPFRTAEKPEDTICEMWARMWCMQRHREDLQEFAKGRLHGLFSDPKHADTAAAIPQAARDELYRRGIPLKSDEEQLPTA